MALTDLKIKKAATREKAYKLSDGGGLFLLVKPNGSRLMAKDFARQVAEIQIRVAVLNRYAALGIPITLAEG